MWPRWWPRDCGGGAPVSRGFDSRQLVATRDSSILFVGQWGPDWVYSTDSGEEPTGNSLRYWALNLETGETRELGAELPELPPSSTMDRYLCSGWTSSSGPAGWTGGDAKITDTTTGAETVIDRVVVGFPACPTDENTVLWLWRSEPDGSVTLWTGRYDDLRQVPLPIVVREFLYGAPHVVVATTADAPEARGALFDRPDRPGDHHANHPGRARRRGLGLRRDPHGRTGVRRPGPPKRARPLWRGGLRSTNG